jgi:hypothetical protein
LGTGKNRSSFLQFLHTAKWGAPQLVTSL